MFQMAFCLLWSLVVVKYQFNTNSLLKWNVFSELKSVVVQMLNDYLSLDQSSVQFCKYGINMTKKKFKSEKSSGH